MSANLEEASLKLNLTSFEEFEAAVKKHAIRLVDLTFTDPLSLWHHCSFTPSSFTEKSMKEGLHFDGSSIQLFRSIEEADMVMIPDLSTAWLDPFAKYVTLHMTCDVREPLSSEAYRRDPRSMAKAAVEYLKSTGIADLALTGAEPEFFVFSSVEYQTAPNSSMFRVDADEGYWNTGRKDPNIPNLGHRAGPKSFYFPVSPIDTMTDLRAEMLLTMGTLGLPIVDHYHEVATSQCELGIKAQSLVECADSVQVYKYVVRNVARSHNKTATFLPKPIYGDYGNGMHVHMSLWKHGQPLFFGDGPAGLSQLALYFIGGILRHAAAITAFSNPTTNSYKRLVPGFEAPVNLVFSAANRSAAIRIPMFSPNDPTLKRIEFRVPDGTGNPYFAFSAMLLAGIDGIIHKINPGSPLNTDIYELSADEKEDLAVTPATLGDALSALEADHEFLLAGNVFTEDFIDAYIAFKRCEISRLETAPHPLEFEMYYHI